MGIIVNRPAERVDFPQLLVQLKVIGPDGNSFAGGGEFHAGAERGPRRHQPRFRASFQRFFHRQFHFAHRGRRVA